MIRSLELTNFKSFKHEVISCSGFTLLIGTNASGKSNIRDAFRFLHGIGRGYELPEIIGGKFEGGAHVWEGIRGGPRYLGYRGSSEISLAADLEVPVSRDAEGKVVTPEPFRYLLATVVDGDQARISKEFLYRDGSPVFEATMGRVPLTAASQVLNVAYGEDRQWTQIFGNGPVLASARVPERASAGAFWVGSLQYIAIQGFRQIHFLEPDADAMREPSYAAQTTLGDRGENLPSLLKQICQDRNEKEAFLGWIKALTPLDVVDFEFPEDVQGRVQLVLKESKGQLTPAASASDGTLRFLAYLTAFFSKAPATYFIEELENGIHPNRLHLLVDLIESRVKVNPLQVIATSHSPSLLRVLSKESLENVVVLFRSEGEGCTHAALLKDLPEFSKTVKTHDVAQLYDSGWFESVAQYARDEKKSA